MIRSFIASVVSVAIVLVLFLAFIAVLVIGAGCSGPASRRVLSTVEIEYGTSSSDGEIDPARLLPASMDSDTYYVGVSIQPFAALTMNDEIAAQHEATERAYAHFVAAQFDFAPIETPPKDADPRPSDDLNPDASRAAVPSNSRTCVWIALGAAIAVFACIAWRLCYGKPNEPVAVAVKRRMSKTDGGCS